MTDPPEPSPAEPAEPIEPPLPPLPPDPPPAVESTRRLIGASFELITSTSEEMRRASFYIGAIVLGTIGPFALASLALEVVSVQRTNAEYDALLDSGVGAWYGLLGVLAVLGLLVAAVESRTMASAILGGQYAHRPVGVRRALARSRMVFWHAIVASIIVSIPVTIAQQLVNGVLEGALGGMAEASLVTSTLVAAIVGAPFAYVLAGVVLGDVDPFEATRRSFRVFRARKLAAAVVAVFETVAVLLVALGLGAGLDIALRGFDALGLGANSGPVGLTLIALGIVVGVFAFGTLIYTALAISLAPQVVMFVGLTRATIGLDHVRPRRRSRPCRTHDRAPAVPLADDPDAARDDRRRDRHRRHPRHRRRVTVSPPRARGAGRRRCRGGGPARGPPSARPRRRGPQDRRSPPRAGVGRA